MTVSNATTYDRALFVEQTTALLGQLPPEHAIGIAVGVALRLMELAGYDEERMRLTFKMAVDDLSIPSSEDLPSTSPEESIDSPEEEPER